MNVRLRNTDLRLRRIPTRTERERRKQAWNVGLMVVGVVAYLAFVLTKVMQWW